MNSTKNESSSFGGMPERIIARDIVVAQVMYQNGTLTVAQLSELLSLNNNNVRNALYRLMRYDLVEKIHKPGALIEYAVTNQVVEHFIWLEKIVDKPVNDNLGNLH